MSKKSKRIQDHVNGLLFDATGDLKRALKNHAHMHDANDLLPQFTALSWKVNGINTRLIMEGKEQSDQNRRLTELEEKIKEQRGDYHDHIRQLVTENEAAHKDLLQKIFDQNAMRLRLDEQIKSLKQTADAARECSNKQAAAITELQKQVKALQGKKVK
jgi:hypothetical protein